MFVIAATGVAVVASVSMPDVPKTSTYREAVVARHAGRAAEAARLLEQWLGERPNDVDARLHYGYALLDLGRAADAEQAFLQVLERAPDYADARIGLARIAQRRGDGARARAWLRPVPADNADASVIRTQLEKAGGPRWTVDMSAGVTAVGRGQPNWREASGQIAWRASDETSVSGRIEASRRFGMHDIYGEAQLVRRFSPRFSTYLVAGGAPKANYRPRWQVGGGASSVVHGGANATVLSFDLREARYDSGRVATLQTGVEQYVLGGKASLTGRLIALVDGGRVQAGALSRIDVQANSGLRLFGGAANAPDTSEGVVTRVTSLFGGVEAVLGPRQVLRLSLAHTDQQVGASRTEFTLGAGLRL
ncbi:YaiO family outer membrane beta-barrel protein [Sphingomonas sp. LHG3406-1]|uniref:YaiO family outer membrane beta-barrel protein n=1 Tax=Sphingomonas sp. LHG3406-1 TaxID=2804617 RepID=UPI0026164ED8|nr:YaiO family outer membrane beta-barrel protein [Sphingomonas sp. LHG3406-1]